jgi:branched-chain amino acid transport system ATP-binding protein
MPHETHLEASGVFANYGSSQVLHGVSLKCERGRITAILGRNGVGKSTTLKSVIGLVRPRKGSIKLGDKEIAGLAPHQLARLGIAYVPEERLIFPTLTVMENLQMGCRKKRRASSQRNTWSIDEVLEMFPGLKRRITSQGQFLSGGEQQMLSIGRALVSNPEIMLIDDPSEGLAPVIVDVVESVIRNVAERGVSVLLVESKLPVVERLADKVYVMAKGQVVYDGEVEALKRDTDVRKRYLEV